MAIIYETSGRAREYFELAANLFKGCAHGCVYCYGPDVLRLGSDLDFTKPTFKENALAALGVDALRLKRAGETRHVLLSFITDPYQPIEKDLQLTRRGVELLKAARLGVAILTKGGFLATRDFDLLDDGDLFGVTLTFLDPKRSRSWEPGAALPIDRMKSLEDAKRRGIGTWVSLEPVIDPSETFRLIEATADFVDVFKVGTLNYSRNLPRDFTKPRIEWKNFARNVIILLDRLGKSYYIKKDLARFVGQPDGIVHGQVPK